MDQQPEPHPELQPETINEFELEPDLVPEPEIDVELEVVFAAESVPKLELEAVSKPDPTLERELASSSDLPPAPVLSIKIPLLHEYLDPFLIKEPDATFFQLSIEELVPWRFIFPSSSSSVIRSVDMGIHHQLLETRLCDFHYINSRTSFSHQGSLMRSSSANGWEIGRAHV